jgi:hypothetical protein
MNLRGVLMHLLVLFGWGYILGGLVFFAWSGPGHWWPLSALIAGSSALGIHLIEIPLLWKKGRELGHSPGSIFWRTLVFGVIWLFFPLKTSA